MGRAAVGGLLVSPGCALALRAASPANRRFHDCIGMQIPDHHGHPRVCLGKVRPESAGVMAVSIPTIRSPLGAPCFEKTHPSLGPTCHEPMTIKPRRFLHVVQISFFSDPEERSPAQLLDAWPTLLDIAEAACRSGNPASLVQASSHSERLIRRGVR